MRRCGRRRQRPSESAQGHCPFEEHQATSTRHQPLEKRSPCLSTWFSAAYADKRPAVRILVRFAVRFSPCRHNCVVAPQGCPRASKPVITPVTQPAGAFYYQFHKNENDQIQGVQNHRSRSARADDHRLQNDIQARRIWRGLHQLSVLNQPVLSAGTWKCLHIETRCLGHRDDAGSRTDYPT